MSAMEHRPLAITVEGINTANAARVSAAMLDHDTLGLRESIGRVA
jgi:hypothetical protein